MKPALFIILIFISIACKKTQVEGTVYSKNNVPVPNARIVLQIYTTASSYPTSTQNQPETDDSGNYSFEFKANTWNKKYRYKIACYVPSDSGHAGEHYIDKGVANHIDIYLK